MIIAGAVATTFWVVVATLVLFGVIIGLIIGRRR